MRSQPTPNAALGLAGAGLSDLSPAQVEAAIVALDRELVRRHGFYKFVELAWQAVPYNGSTPFEPSWHIEEMCIHAELATPGSRFNPDVRETPKITDLVVNIPPGYTKSMVFSVFYQAWVWTFRPEFRVIWASYANKLVRDNAGHLRDLMRSDWYIKRWGSLLDPNKSRILADFKTREGGFRFSTTIGGQGTGSHCHTFIVDDPIKPPDEKRALAGDDPAAIDKANSWLKSVRASRSLHRPTYVKILVMQRLAENDPTGNVLTLPGVTHLRLPAKYDDRNPSLTQWGGDRRCANFTSPYARTTEVTDPIMLNPRRYPAASENARARDMGGWEGPIASAQLQQDPTPAGGLIFKVETFKRFSASQYPHHKTFLTLSVDCNFKKSAINSDVGITIEGITPEGKILVYWWGSETLGWVETRQRIIELISTWRPNVILIEDKANGSALIDELKQTFEIGNVLGPNPDTTKESRAQAANVGYQAGMVYHNAEGMGGGHLGGVADFEGALAKFPRGLKKDVIDAHSMAVLYLMSTNQAEQMAAMAAMGDLTKAFARHFRLG